AWRQVGQARQRRRDGSHDRVRSIVLRILDIWVALLVTLCRFSPLDGLVTTAPNICSKSPMWANRWDRSWAAPGRAINGLGYLAPPPLPPSPGHCSPRLMASRVGRVVGQRDGSVIAAGDPRWIAPSTT